jgi:hypothetical protein
MLRKSAQIVQIFLGVVDDASESGEPVDDFFVSLALDFQIDYLIR